MNRRQAARAALALAVLRLSEAVAGPYSAGRNDPTHPVDPPIPGYLGPAGAGLNEPGNTLNPLFVAWVSGVSHYAPAAGLDAGWKDTGLARGPVTGDQFDITGLGELDGPALNAGHPPGRIDLEFPYQVVDGPGPDFAVFENGFDGFMELAFVEVSSDGVTFARFPATSLTPSAVAPYTAFDPTNLHNLAGKHHNNNGECWGTPFDLHQLEGTPGLDLQNVRYVRIVDIPGRGDFPDAAGRPVYDPWPTFGSGGFDLEAVGMIHARVEVLFKALGQPPVSAGCVRWSGVPNRLNRLLTSTESVLGPWETVVELDGSDSESEYQFPGLTWESRRYFKVELVPLP